MIRSILAWTFAFLLAFAHATASAQAWPTKPVRFILPFAAGGGGDTVFRPFTQRLSEALGVPVLIENVTGAGGVLGVKAALSAQPDDHTFLMISNSQAVLETLQPNRGYDLMRDFVPVAAMAAQPLVLVVNPKVAARDLPELVALARKNPGKLTYGSAGSGTIYHLVAEVFLQDLKLSMVHVPYRSSGVARQDLVAGQIDVLFDGVGTIKPLIDSGRVRALAMAGAPNPHLPGLPPVSGVAPGFQEDSWLGFMAPRTTSVTAVRRMQDAILALVRSDAGRKTLDELGSTPLPLDGAAFGAVVRKDIQKWERVIKAANIKAE